ncbi:MAG: metallophosphoesterase [Elusimicrobiota bacterium]|jgi:hypothetical protein|nr:metallophosphoesterase [Elusimicrobiota bacterium]
MKRLLILPLLFLTAAANAARIERGPYAEDPAHTTMVLKWATDVPSAAWVEYGPLGQCSQLMAVSAKKIEHSLTLHGLIANTKFCYKIYVQNAEETGVQEPVEGHFQTLFSPERKIVNFSVIGNTSAPRDGRDTGPLKEALAGALAAHEADFVLHTGNLVSTGLIADAQAEFFTPFANYLKNTPLLSAVGKDEYGPDGDTELGRGFLTANYRKIHSMPWSRGTPNYYYIDTANARIIVLDTNKVFDTWGAPALADKSPQFNWLKTALSSAGAGKWKIVVMHHPVYSSGPQEDRLSRLLAPVFEANRVNLVIQGHQGAYERTQPIRREEAAQNGPVYITIGGGGKTLEPAAYKNEWGAKYFEVPHFAHIQIVDRKLALRVYTHDNKRIDALDIHL